MSADAVELVVGFAGTQLSHTRVRPNERFLIGNAPNVDLPMELGGASFPLIDRGLVVRIPIGCDPVQCGDTTVLSIGLVTIGITRVSDQPIVMPRPRGVWRLVPYLIATLVLHLAVVVLAMWAADVDPITIPVVRAEPPRHVMTAKLPTPKPPKTRKQAADKAPHNERPTEWPSEPPTQQGAREAARNAGVLGSANVDEYVSRLTGSVDLAAALADLGPMYDEQAANAQNFGNSAGNFDPTKDPAFDSVKTGRYATGTGKMGQNYRLPSRGKFREVERPPIMGLTCDDGECTTVGMLDRFTVRDYVEKR